MLKHWPQTFVTFTRWNHSIVWNITGCSSIKLSGLAQTTKYSLRPKVQNLVWTEPYSICVLSAFAFCLLVTLIWTLIAGLWPARFRLPHLKLCSSLDTGYGLFFCYTTASACCSFFLLSRWDKLLIRFMSLHKSVFLKAYIPIDASCWYHSGLKLACAWLEHSINDCGLINWSVLCGKRFSFG